MLKQRGKNRCLKMYHSQINLKYIYRERCR